MDQKKQINEYLDRMVNIGEKLVAPSLPQFGQYEPPVFKISAISDNVRELIGKLLTACDGSRIDDIRLAASIVQTYIEAQGRVGYAVAFPPSSSHS